MASISQTEECVLSGNELQEDVIVMGSVGNGGPAVIDKTPQEKKTAEAAYKDLFYLGSFHD